MTFEQSSTQKIDNKPDRIPKTPREVGAQKNRMSRDLSQTNKKLKQVDGRLKALDARLQQVGENKGVMTSATKSSILDVDPKAGARVRKAMDAKPIARNTISEKDGRPSPFLEPGSLSQESGLKKAVKDIPAEKLPGVEDDIMSSAPPIDRTVKDPFAEKLDVLDPDIAGDITNDIKGHLDEAFKGDEVELKLSPDNNDAIIAAEEQFSKQVDKFQNEEETDEEKAWFKKGERFSKGEEKALDQSVVDRYRAEELKDDGSDGQAVELSSEADRIDKLKLELGQKMEELKQLQEENKKIKLWQVGKKFNMRSQIKAAQNEVKAYTENILLIQDATDKPVSPRVVGSGTGRTSREQMRPQQEEQLEQKMKKSA